MNRFGKHVYCNGRCDRAPKIGGFVFPICWRCLSFIVGILISYILIEVKVIDNSIFWSLVFSPASICCLIDVFRQKHNKEYESNNYKRVVFGLGAGFDIRVFVYFMFSI